MKILGIVFLLVVGVIVWSGYRSPAPPAVPPVPAPELSAAEKAKEAKFQADVRALRRLRSAMKNPDSFKLEQALQMDDGTLCVVYRGTNSFNAVVPGRALIINGGFMDDSDSTFITRWNSKCGGKSGSDISYIRRAL